MVYHFYLVKWQVTALTEASAIRTISCGQDKSLGAYALGLILIYLDGYQGSFEHTSLI